MYCISEIKIKNSQQNSFIEGTWDIYAKIFPFYFSRNIFGFNHIFLYQILYQISVQVWLHRESLWVYPTTGTESTPGLTSEVLYQMSSRPSMNRLS